MHNLTFDKIIISLALGITFCTLITPSLAATVNYSTYLGGSFNDYGEDVAVDSSGNAYVTGYTASSDFPTKIPYQGSYFGGSWDAFVSKFSTSGSLIYSTFLAGGGNDKAYGITVDSAGSAYITGSTLSNDYPTYGAYQPAFASTYSLWPDVFVTKIKPEGTSLAYSTYLGGASSEVGNDIAVDKWGQAHICGYTESTNFPLQSSYQGSISGSPQDAFVSKLSVAGNVLSYSTYLGGSSTDTSYSLVLDSTGNAYVTGTTEPMDFPTLSPFQGTKAGFSYKDTFVTKLSPTGNTLSYSTYLGGSGVDDGYAIDIDPWGNAYIAGHTTSANFPTLNPYDGAFGGGQEAFLTKLKASGTILSFSTFLGGSGAEYGYGLAVDSTGCAYMTGQTQSTDFPTRSPYQSTPGSPTDAFITKFANTGQILTYSTFLGGGSQEVGYGIAVDPNWHASAAGYTSSSDFPAVNPYQGTKSGSLTDDAFVARVQRYPNDTIGVFRPSATRFYLRNTNSGGAADLNFNFGSSTDKPVSGDWNGGGITTTGVFRPSTRTFFLRNSNTPGPADISFLFGASTDIPITGDWDGDGDITIGLYRPSNKTFYLKNWNTGGIADISAVFGGSGDTPITGDWNGDSIDTIGVFRPSNANFYLRYFNSAGSADVSFLFGSGSDKPVVGDWDYY